MRELATCKQLGRLPERIESKVPPAIVGDDEHDPIKTITEIRRPSSTLGIPTPRVFGARRSSPDQCQSVRRPRFRTDKLTKVAHNGEAGRGPRHAVAPR